MLGGPRMVSGATRIVLGGTQTVLGDARFGPKSGCPNGPWYFSDIFGER